MLTRSQGGFHYWKKIQRYLVIEKKCTPLNPQYYVLKEECFTILYCTYLVEVEVAWHWFFNRYSLYFITSVFFNIYCWYLYCLFLQLNFTAPGCGGQLMFFTYLYVLWWTLVAKLILCLIRTGYRYLDSLWCSANKALQHFGALTMWHLSTLVHWQWVTSALWCTDNEAPHHFGALTMRHLSTLMQCQQGTSALWCTDKEVPQHFGALTMRYLSTLVHWQWGTSALWFTDNEAPQHFSALTMRHLSTLVHWH